MMRINFEEVVNEDEYNEEQNFYDVAKARKAVGGLFADNSKTTKASGVAIDVLPAEVSEETVTKTEKKPEKIRSPKSRYVFTDDGLEENLDSKNKKYEHIEIVHHDSPKQKEAKKAVSAKPSTPPKRKSTASYASIEGDAGLLSDSESILSSTIRWIAIVLATIFLLMMVFLIARNNMLSNQLADATTRAERADALANDLSQARIDLDIAIEQLAYAESRLETDTLIPPPNLNDEAATEGDSTYAAYSAGYNDTDYNTYEPAAGGTTEAAGVRTHEVASGDNLSRIANRFYGNASYANIQRIREANNMTNDIIRVGQILVIPN